MRMKLNLKQQKVSLDLSNRTILTQDHAKLLNIEAHASGHTGFVYDEDFVAYQKKVKTTADNLQNQIDNLDVGYITEEEMQQHLADQAVINAALQDKDDKLEASIKAVDNKLDDETSARQTEDATLQQNIDANTAKITNNTSLIKDEVTDRKAADTALQNNINSNTTFINQEVSDRQASDNALNTQITKNSEDIAALGTQLDEETSNRKSADSALDTRLSTVETGLTTETANRIKDDDTLHDLIVAEQTARENVDTSLQGQIDTHQSNIASLQTDLANETSTREAQDVVLQTNINNEASTRKNTDENLQTQIDQLKGLGGYLTAHDFGTATPTQDDLTNYAMTQINVPDKYGIFNMTRVTNLYDGNLWILTNTQDTNPPVFEWSNNGNDTVSIATEDAAGILRSSNAQYELTVNSTTQTGSINGLVAKLNTIDAKNSQQDASIMSLQDVKLNKNVSTSTYTQVYAKNTDGSQDMQNISTNADANTIAQRGTGGVLNVGIPTANTHAATKKYVDDKQILFDTSAPKMNGTASVGSSIAASRGDHVHPSDTSKADLNGWTANRVLITSGAGVLTAGSITSTELGYLSGVSSNLQTQLNGKLNTSGTAVDSNKLGGQLPSYYLDYNNLANTPTIPTKMSQLTNDTNYISDASYVHTDNNFTTTLLNKLNGIAAGAQVNKIEVIKVNGSAMTITNKEVNIPIDYGSYIPTTEKGSAGGVASLGSDGKVPSSQLPSYVDDVLEYTSKANFPATGETGKIYVDTTTNITYRWSGNSYVEISASLALGETSSTAYAGNKGKANADAISVLQERATTIETKNTSQDTSITNIVNGTTTVGKATTAETVKGKEVLATDGSVEMKGDLQFAQSGDSGVRGIVFQNATDDYGRIVGGATYLNKGYLEISTADDGTEPIYVRQYRNGKFSTLARTATLLDASGNTSFPGNVSMAGGIVYGTLTIADTEGSGLSDNRIAIGDDAYILDIDAANAVGIVGQADSSYGGIKFGTSGGLLGYFGSGLTYAGNKIHDDSNLSFSLSGTTLTITKS